jgi:prevent-host-death family protein
MYVHPKRRDLEDAVERGSGADPGPGAERWRGEETGPGAVALSLEYPDALPEVGVKAFSRSVSRFLAQVEQEGRLIITKQNRPIALLISVDEAEDFFLAHAPELVRTRLDARDEWRRDATVGFGDLP